MKRVLAIVMTAAVSLTSFIFPVYADEADAGLSSGILIETDEWSKNELNDWENVENFDINNDADGISQTGKIVSTNGATARMYHTLGDGINVKDPTEDMDYYIYAKVKQDVTENTDDQGRFSMYLLNNEQLEMGTDKYVFQGSNSTYYDPNKWDTLPDNKKGFRPSPGRGADGGGLLSGFLPSIESDKWYNWLWKIHIPAADSNEKKSIHLKVWAVGDEEPDFPSGGFTNFEGQSGNEYYKLSPKANVIGFVVDKMGVINMADMGVTAVSPNSVTDYNDLKAKIKDLRQKYNEGVLTVEGSKQMQAEISDAVDIQIGVFKILANEEFKSINEKLNNIYSSIKTVNNLLDKWENKTIDEKNINKAYSDVQTVKTELEKIKCFGEEYSRLNTRLTPIDENIEGYAIQESYEKLVENGITLDKKQEDITLSKKISLNNKCTYYIVWQQTIKECNNDKKAGMEIGDLFAGAVNSDGKLLPAIISGGETPNPKYGDAELQLNQSYRFKLKLTSDETGKVNAALSVTGADKKAEELETEWTTQTKEYDKITLTAEDASAIIGSVEKQEHTSAYEKIVQEVEEVVSKAEAEKTKLNFETAKKALEQLRTGIAKNEFNARLSRVEEYVKNAVPEILKVSVVGDLRPGGEAKVLYESVDSAGTGKDPIIEWSVAGKTVTGVNAVDIPQGSGGGRISCSITPVNIYDVKGESKSCTMTISGRGSSGGSSSGSSGSGGNVYYGSGKTGGGTAGTGSSAAVPQYTVGKKSFSDVNGHWAEKEILSLAENCIVNGVSEQEFRPDANITRSEFTAIVVRMLGLETVKYSDTYVDVRDTDWFADAVSTASIAGLTSGSDGYFYPERNITREEMAKIIAQAWSLKSLKNLSAGELGFADSENVSEWAKKYVGAACKLGLIKGTDNNMFAPQKNATRAEAAVVVKRLLDMNIQKPDPPAGYVDTRKQSAAVTSVDDDLTDWSKSVSHSNGLEIKADENAAEGMKARVFRKDTASKEIVYKLGKNIKDFTILGYAGKMTTLDQANAAYAVYVSKDGEEWDLVELSDKLNSRDTGNGGFKFVDLKPADTISGGYSWLKVEIRANSSTWENQIGHIKITS